MVLTWFEWHVNSQEAFPDTMTELRKHVCTQDVMLRLKIKTYDNPSSAQLKTVRGINMSKAFGSSVHRHSLKT